MRSCAAACTQALTFWGRVVPILGAYKAVELAQEYGEKLPAGLADTLNLPVTEEAAEARYEELHEWGSERLESTIQDLKGFYVKTGQVISTRVDLFPEQYTSRLASLQDDLDPMPASQVPGHEPVQDGGLWRWRARARGWGRGGGRGWGARIGLVSSSRLRARFVLGRVAVVWGELLLLLLPQPQP